MHLQKNSVYLETFSIVIERLKEAGIIDKYLQDVLLDPNQKSVKTSIQTEKLTISHLQVQLFLFK